MHTGFTSRTSFKRTRLRALLGGAVATVATVIALLPAVAQADVVGTHVVTPQTVAPHVVTPAPVAAPASAPAPTPASAPTTSASASSPEPAPEPYPEVIQHSEWEYHPYDFETRTEAHVHQAILVTLPTTRADSPADPMWEAWRAVEDLTQHEVKVWLKEIVHQVLDSYPMNEQWVPHLPSLERFPSAPPLPTPPKPPAPVDPSEISPTGESEPISNAPSPEEYAPTAEENCQCSIAPDGSGGPHWRSDSEDPEMEQR
jgi:hypothetical protein